LHLKCNLSSTMNILKTSLPSQINTNYDNNIIVALVVVQIVMRPRESELHAIALRRVCPNSKLHIISAYYSVGYNLIVYDIV